MNRERYHDPRITYALLSHILCHKAVSRLSARLPTRVSAIRRQWMLEPDREPEDEEVLPWMMEAQIVFPAGSPKVCILLWLGGGEEDAYWKVKGRYGAWGEMSGFHSLAEAEAALEELHQELAQVVDEFFAPLTDDERMVSPFTEDEEFNP